MKTEKEINTKDEKIALIKRYTNGKKGKQFTDTKKLLEYADTIINSAYPYFNKNNTQEAYKEAYKYKTVIHDFYMEAVAPDYAELEGITPAQAEEKLNKETGKLYKSLRGSPYAGGKNAPYLYLQEIHTATTEHNYKCSLFPPREYNTPLTFKLKTLSFIAGRPGAGKTTALVSITMDVLRTTKKNVLFITDEETIEEVMTSFIKNQFCNNCNGINEHLLKDWKGDNIDDYFMDELNAIYTEKAQTLPNLNIDTFTDFQKELIKAFNEVKDFFESGRLQFFDLEQTSKFEELIDAINEQEQYSVIILDYIQNLPHGKLEGANLSGSEGGRREDIRQSTEAINEAIKKNNLIGIAGAQFNRVGANTSKPEPLDLTNMGDTGTLERIANIIVGLGYYTKDNNLTYFYTVLKNRKSKKSFSHYKIYSNYYGYAYIRADKTSVYNESKDELISIDFNNLQTSNPEPKQKPQNKDNKTEGRYPVILDENGERQMLPRNYKG